MRRFLAISLTALLLLVGPSATPATADVHGPACAEITGSSQHTTYQVTQVSGSADAVLSVEITTAKPLCIEAPFNATLIVHVSDGTTTITTATYPGDTGFSPCNLYGTCFTFTNDYGAAASAPSSVFVYLESTIRGRVADRAPNSGAIEFILCDPSIPGSCSGGGGEFFE